MMNINLTRNLTDICDTQQDIYHSQRGMTLTQLLAGVAIIGVLSAIAVGVYRNISPEAKLARCMANVVSVQAAVAANSGDNKYQRPTPEELWEKGFHCDIDNKPGALEGIHYLPNNSDKNRGHGNDLDGFDEENPGKAPRNPVPFDYYIFCMHDHSKVIDKDTGLPVKYVWLRGDDMPPQLATEGNDPGAQELIKYLKK